MLEMLSAVKDRDEAQDLDMAFRLSNDLLQAVATTVCSCDLVEALDGLLEYVQQHEHNDDLEVQQLGTWFAEMKTPTEFFFLIWRDENQLTKMKQFDLVPLWDKTFWGAFFCTTDN